MSNKAVAHQEASFKPTGSMKRHERARGQVLFNAAVEVSEVLHINNYTDQECANCWYTKRDLYWMETDCIVTIELLKGGSNLEDSTSYCMLGLERKLDRYCGNNSCLIRRRFPWRKKSRKAAGINAVLEEQDLQLHTGITDAKAISAAYINAIRSPWVEDETKKFTQSGGISSRRRSRRLECSSSRTDRKERRWTSNAQLFLMFKTRRRRR